MSRKYVFVYQNLFKRIRYKLAMDKWTEILVGLVLVVGAVLVAWESSVYGWAVFGHNLDFLNAAWTFFKGGLWWLVFMVGALFVLLGISDLKG